MSTIIHYFVPEDREDSDKLNAFVVCKEYKDVRISDIKDNFPLPGEYIFRFKFDFQKKIVWIDFNNPDNCLPKYDSKIIMKVTRISWTSVEEEQKEKTSSEFPNI